MRGKRLRRVCSGHASLYDQPSDIARHGDRVCSVANLAIAGVLTRLQLFLPEFSRCLAEPLAECSAEMRQIVKAPSEGNVGYGNNIRVGEVLGATFKALFKDYPTV